MINMLEKQCSAANIFEETHDNKLMEAVQLCYTETSSLVLNTLFKRYKLVDHFSAMRKYLLLGQGDLIRYLMELLDGELSAPANTLYPHNLAGEKFHNFSIIHILREINFGGSTSAKSAIFTHFRCSDFLPLCIFCTF